MSPSKLQPALLGGAALGVLSALPIVGAANCCCIWFITGGVLAAWLLQQNHPDPITPGDGALVGLLAGVVGAVVTLVISIPLRALTGSMHQRMLSRMLERAGDLPPDVRSTIEPLLHGGGGIALMLLGFLVNLVLASVFATLGGLIGAMLFKKQAPPTMGPPSVPPSGPPPLPPTF